MWVCVKRLNEFRPLIVAKPQAAEGLDDAETNLALSVLLRPCRLTVHALPSRNRLLLFCDAFAGQFGIGHLIDPGDIPSEFRIGPSTSQETRVPGLRAVEFCLQSLTDRYWSLSSWEQEATSCSPPLRLIEPL